MQAIGMFHIKKKKKDDFFFVFVFVFVLLLNVYPFLEIGGIFLALWSSESQA